MDTAKPLFTHCFPRATLTEQHQLFSTSSTEYVYSLPDNLGILSITERKVCGHLNLRWSLARHPAYTVFQYYSFDKDQLKLHWGTHAPCQGGHSHYLTAPLASLKSLIWHFFAIVAKGNQYNPDQQTLPSFVTSTFKAAQRFLTLRQQRRRSLPKRDASPRRSGRTALKTATNCL